MAAATMHATAAFNAGRWLVPLTIGRDTALLTTVMRANVQFRVGAPIGFIGPSSRCVENCVQYGPGAKLTIPGKFGKYYIHLHWHRAGCHQLSCRYGKQVQARHKKLNLLIAEELALAGCVVDPSETFVSATDNKRADMLLWHQAVSDKGIACDTCVWNDFTLARLHLSAATAGYALLAAEKYKMDKYVALCLAANLDFRPFAVNPLGGFGPALLKVHQQVWGAKREDALRMGVQVRAIESQERRALEKLSCEMARCFYRSTYLNQTGRTRNDFAAPPQADRDADAQQMPHE